MRLQGAVSLFLALLLVGVATAQQNVLSSLSSFQTSSGGFVDRNASDVRATATSTADALFLSTFFSIPVDDQKAFDFLASLANPQGGYANQRGDAPSLEGTRAAIVSYAHFRTADPQGAASAAFLQKYAGSTDVGELLQVFESAALLGQLEEGWARALIESTRALLEQRLVDEDGVQYFESDSSTMSVSAYNMAATQLSQYVELELSNLESFASFWTQLQDQVTGCFSSSPDAQDGSLESTVAAVRALFTLRSVAQCSQIPFELNRLINVGGLRRCLAITAGNTVRDTALSQLAVALTNPEELFTATWKYLVVKGSPVSEEKNVVQGSAVRPQLTLRANQGGVQPHWDVQSRIIVAGEDEPISLPLPATRDWVYRSESDFDTSPYLGEANVVFYIGTQLPTIGYVGFVKFERLRIGYGLSIRSTASHEESGAEFGVGDVVSAGTAFEFDVHPFTELANAEYDAESLQLEVQVLDSAGVAIHHDLVDPEAAAAGELPDFHVKYALTRDDLPPGQLTFAFRIEGAREDGSTFVHTSRSVHYSVGGFLGAQDVEVDDASRLRFGDSLHASMRAVTSQSLHSGVTLLSNPESRRFSLDLVASNGQVVASAPGAVAGGAVEFDLSVPASLELLGDFAVQFSYKARDGQRIVLLVVNDEGELDEDNTDAAKATIGAQLAFESVDGASIPSNLVYGELVSYSFSVSDTLTEQPARGVVYLRIAHASGARSVNVPLRANAASVYQVSHRVSANALKGSAQLSFEVETADGQVTTLFTQPINIDGNIEHEEFVYSTNSLIATHTSFLGVFKLRCNDVALADARLVATAYYRGKPVAGAANLPVATTTSGFYSVSFNSPLREANGGLYEIRVAREIDPETPLLVLNIEHTNPADHKLPVRSEWIALILLAFSFVKIYQALPRAAEQKRK